MREALGLLFILSGVVFGTVMLLGFDFSIKEKIAGVFIFEVFLCLIVFGSYMLTGA